LKMGERMIRKKLEIKDVKLKGIERGRSRRR
jgi:hypothetical protein